MEDKNLFQFTLKSIDECDLNGVEEKNIWWYWLTDSYYGINLGEVQLFKSSSERVQKYPGNAFLDYYYIRFLEDFFDILPEIAASIPQDLYEFVDSEEKREITYNRLIEFWEEHEDENEDVPEEIEEIYLTARKILYHGVLDTGHLRFTSLCRFCRVDDEIIIHYNFRDQDEDGLPVWEAGMGQYSIGYDRFLEEVETMLFNFFSAMDVQINSAVEEARKNPGKYVLEAKRDVRNPDEMLVILKEEQEKRKEQFFSVLENVKNGKSNLDTSWDEIRKALQASGLLTNEK